MCLGRAFFYLDLEKVIDTETKAAQALNISSNLQDTADQILYLCSPRD